MYENHTMTEDIWEKRFGEQSYLNKTLRSQNTWMEKQLRAKSRGEILTPLSAAGMMSSYGKALYICKQNRYKTPIDVYAIFSFSVMWNICAVGGRQRARETKSDRSFIPSL